MGFSSVIIILLIVVKMITSLETLPRFKGIEEMKGASADGQKYANPRRNMKNKNEFCTTQEDLLLYSTNNQLKVFNFATNQTSVIQNNVDCKGLSVSGNFSYYGMVEMNTGYVLRTSIINGDTELGFETRSPIIFSIDVDWITGNVYFSTDKSVSVCSKYGHLCAEIRTLNNSTDSCYIGLAPRSAFLFYSLRSQHKGNQFSRIMRLSMDGSDEKVLASKRLRMPTSLTVDESSKKVYWLDSDFTFSTIESIGYNGRNRRIWFSHSQMNLFAMSEMKNTFFWTRENFNSIGMNSDSEFITDKNATTIKYLYAYNTLLQRTKIPNPCKKAPCEGLCLLRKSPMKQLDFACLCANFTPSSGSHWCTDDAKETDWNTDVDSEERKSGWFSTIISAIVYGLMIILASASVGLILRKHILCYYRRLWSNRSRTEYIEL